MNVLKGYAERRRLLRGLVTFPCRTCKGTGFSDWRVGEKGIVTAEAEGVRVKFCPDCNGAGVRIGLPAWHKQHVWEEYETEGGRWHWRRCVECRQVEEIPSGLVVTATGMEVSEEPFTGAVDLMSPVVSGTVTIQPESITIDGTKLKWTVKASPPSWIPVLTAAFVIVSGVVLAVCGVI